MSQHKYGAKPTTVDGIRFASLKESRRYQELRLLEKAGEIEDLSLQPEFVLDVNDETLGVYRADFAYYPCHRSGPHKGAIIGHQVIEDVKSPPTKTPLWRWKVKHLKAQYGIEVLTT